MPKRLCRAGRTSCASAKLSSSGSMASVSILSSTSPLHSTQAEQVSDLNTDSKQGNSIYRNYCLICVDNQDRLEGMARP